MTFRGRRRSASVHSAANNPGLGSESDSRVRSSKTSNRLAASYADENRPIAAISWCTRQRDLQSEVFHSLEITPAFSSGCIPCCTSAGASAAGNIFPGFAISKGSNARRSRFMQSISSAENMSGR